ncbi:unnamed protein product [Dimorphilus gyrociliatus]|uniref:Uncharacterized protein n=1 Tax=Dimorphilus gyrociliatus TaxID=2664684 RepID=A0A7I8VNR2_9ANNE|nr:unnamed protein product [Dimorphilus gyrociliatus]
MSSKVAIVLGASRGIGRQIALTLGSQHHVVVAAKTVEDSNNLPGNIHSVCSEIKAGGGSALAVKCDVTKESDISNLIQTTIAHYGKLDALVYNAGAILWKTVEDTPLKRYDLMNAVNGRGAYIAVQECMPYFRQQNSGKIILVSQPIYSRFFRGKTPYAMTKTAMTVLTMGLGIELEGSNISITSLWPATVVESFVTAKMGVPNEMMRKSTVFADATKLLVDEPTQKYNGKVLLDEDILRDNGVTDFTKYRCDPNQEPARMMPKNFPDLSVAKQEEQMTGFKSNL